MNDTPPDRVADTNETGATRPSPTQLAPGQKDKLTTSIDELLLWLAAAPLVETVGSGRAHHLKLLAAAYAGVDAGIER